MSDGTKTAAELALEAVRADAVLGRLEWAKADDGVWVISRTGNRSIYHRKSGWAVSDPSSRKAVTFRNLDDAVSWLSARVSALFAACRAVDPECARLREEKDAALARIAQTEAIIGDRIRRDAGYPNTASLEDAVAYLVSVHDQWHELGYFLCVTSDAVDVGYLENVKIVVRERDALRAELAAAKAHATQQWKAGLTAAAAKVKDGARAWKDTDPNLSDALTRTALGILSLSPPEPTT